MVLLTTKGLTTDTVKAVQAFGLPCPTFMSVLTLAVAKIFHIAQLTGRRIRSLKMSQKILNTSVQIGSILSARKLHTIIHGIFPITDLVNFTHHPVRQFCNSFQTKTLSRQMGWHVHFEAQPKARMIRATIVRQDCHIPMPPCYMKHHMMHETHQCHDGKVRFQGDSAENDAFIVSYEASQRTVLSKCHLLVCGCWCTVSAGTYAVASQVTTNISAPPGTHGPEISQLPEQLRSGRKSVRLML